MNVPTPVIKVGGLYNSGEDIPKSALKAGTKLEAKLEGGFFPFKVDYTVTSFTYMKEVRGVTSAQKVSGNTIPADIAADIAKKTSGTPVNFLEVTVSSPSGPRKTPGFAARLK